MSVPRPTQKELVLHLLRDGRWHKTIEFIDLGVLRVGPRVQELRRDGHIIKVQATRPARSGAVVWRYRLIGDRRHVPGQLDFARADVAERADNSTGLQTPWPEPVDDDDDDVELPSPEERRRIAAEQRAAFYRTLERGAE